MKHREIAQKIVDKFGNYNKVEVKAVEEHDEDRTVHMISIAADILPVAAGFQGASKKEVNNLAIDHFEKLLDDEVLVLSDTWAEDNLAD